MKRIVIKIGTNILTTEQGNLDLNTMRELSFQIATLSAQKNIECILVSSGSITCGSEHLQLSPSTIPEKQAAASVGQFLLMKEYAAFFSEKGTKVGQILLTKDGLHHIHRRHHVLNTIEMLLFHGVVPIINENDSVSVDEIQFGDNDELSSDVAILVKADLYIILSDIDGLYSSNPKIDANATLVSTVDTITDDILSMADTTASTDRSKGGMKSKLMATKRAVDNRIPTVIANGRKANVIYDIIEEKSVGTQFTV